MISLVLLLWSASVHAAHIILVLLHVTARILAHVVIIALLLVVVHGTVVVGTSHASPVRGPVQLEEPILLAGNLLAIKSLEDIPGYFVVLELDKAVADGLVGLLVLDEFYVDDLGDAVELHGDVFLGHVGQHVADPEGLALLLILLLRLLHSAGIHHLSALILLAWCSELHRDVWLFIINYSMGKQVD